jgi:hypothetical protein
MPKTTVCHAEVAIVGRDVDRSRAQQFAVSRDRDAQRRARRVQPCYETLHEPFGHVLYDEHWQRKVGRHGAQEVRQCSRSAG